MFVNSHCQGQVGKSERSLATLREEVTFSLCELAWER